MKAIGKFLTGVGRYILRQVCAVLLSSLILVGTALGALLMALIVIIVGTIFSLLVLIAPLLGLSAASMAATLKQKATSAAAKADNVHQFKKPDA